MVTNPWHQGTYVDPSGARRVIGCHLRTISGGSAGGFEKDQGTGRREAGGSRRAASCAIGSTCFAAR